MQSQLSEFQVNFADVRVRELACVHVQAFIYTIIPQLLRSINAVQSWNTRTNLLVLRLSML